MAPDILKLARSVDACLQSHCLAVGPGSSASSDRTTSIQSILSQVYIDLDLAPEPPKPEHAAPSANVPCPATSVAVAAEPETNPSAIRTDRTTEVADRTDLVLSSAPMTLQRPLPKLPLASRPDRKPSAKTPMTVPETRPPGGLNETAEPSPPSLLVAQGDLPSPTGAEPSIVAAQLSPSHTFTSVAPVGDAQTAKRPSGDFEPRAAAAAAAVSGPAGWLRQLFGR